MAKHLDLGRKGESLPKHILENLGYEIMDENWTYGKAEVDLIAYKNKRYYICRSKNPHRQRFWRARRFC